MNKKTCKVLSALLALILCLGVLTACQPKSATPLVVAEGEFSEKFSPFFADTVYDADAMEMTQLVLMTTDRLGGIVYNAIEGEVVPYNGTNYTYTGPCDISVKYDEATNITTYTVKLKEGVKFSDGVEATADDIIFSYYVYADPSYVGPTTLSSHNIVGLKNYQTQTSDQIYEKYKTMFDAIYAAGPDHVWANTDSWTQDLQTAVWDNLKAEWIGDLQAIVDFVVANFLTDSDVSGVFAGKTAADVTEEMYPAYALAMWYFATVNADGTLTGNGTGTVYDLTVAMPTMEDVYNEAYAIYGGDPGAYWSSENAGSVDGTDVLGTVKAAFISGQGAMDPEMAGGVPNIEGIKKLDNYTVEIKTNGFEAPAVYTLFGGYLTPMHYYGDTAQYNYDKNMFGHPFGDLSLVEAKTTQPMGAGPYKFVKYENRIVYFEANENYFKGEPITKNVQFKETVDSELVAGLAAGTVDIGDVSGSKKNFEDIASHNSNGEVSGNQIHTVKVDFRGYGYIGLNADNILVGTKADSAESKALRKAIATVIAVYREVAYDSYFGESASVINYPISNTSWAAPRATDEGYRVAFSVDVDGNDIYNSKMNADEKYAAALKAAIGFFKAAGFTYDEATGKLTAAPEGARLSYEALIRGNGTGDHPSFAVLTDAAAALATIGFELKINDLTDVSVMSDMLDASSQDLWCSAWEASIDPDLYQVYHSSGIVGRGGSDSNYYHIEDPKLDQLIVDARKSGDQSYRKAIYRQALDLIADWAVEIPAYQRQDSTVFSAKRVDIKSITPDITTFWSWLKEIEKVKMK